MRFTPHVREANSQRLEFSVFTSGLFLVQDATKMQYGKLKTSQVNDFKRFANCHVAAGKGFRRPCKSQAVLLSTRFADFAGLYAEMPQC